MLKAKEVVQSQRNGKNSCNVEGYRSVVLRCNADVISLT